MLKRRLPRQNNREHQHLRNEQQKLKEIIKRSRGNRMEEAVSGKPLEVRFQEEGSAPSHKRLAEYAKASRCVLKHVIYRPWTEGEMSKWRQKI